MKFSVIVSNSRDIVFSFLLGVCSIFL